jgi:hypothetical protein
MTGARTAADCIGNYNEGGQAIAVPIPAGTLVKKGPPDGAGVVRYAVATVADAARLIAATYGGDAGPRSMAWHDATHRYLWLPDGVLIDPA